jgi:hypothetical protein
MPIKTFLVDRRIACGVFKHFFMLKIGLPPFSRKGITDPHSAFNKFDGATRSQQYTI